MVNFSLSFKKVIRWCFVFVHNKWKKSTVMPEINFSGKLRLNKIHIAHAIYLFR